MPPPVSLAYVTLITDPSSQRAKCCVSPLTPNHIDVIFGAKEFNSLGSIQRLNSRQSLCGLSHVDITDATREAHAGMVCDGLYTGTSQPRILVDHRSSFVGLQHFTHGIVDSTITLKSIPQVTFSGGRV